VNLPQTPTGSAASAESPTCPGCGSVLVVKVDTEVTTGGVVVRAVPQPHNCPPPTKQTHYWAYPTLLGHTA
jgi:hypothetical protein